MPKKFIIISVFLSIGLITPQIIFAQTQVQPQSSFLAGLSEVIKDLQEQVLSLQKQLQGFIRKPASESYEPIGAPMPTATSKVPKVAPVSSASSEAPQQLEVQSTSENISGAAGGGVTPSSVEATQGTFIQPAIPEKPTSVPIGMQFVKFETLPTKPVVSCTLPEMSIGEQDDSVYLLQQTLKDAGYYPEGLVTGYYGDLTKKAVERFESAQGLMPDGQLDKNTTSVLNQKIKKIIPQCGQTGGVGQTIQPLSTPATQTQPAPAPTAPTYSDYYVKLDELPDSPTVSCVLPVMKQGTRNNSVYLLQMFLKQANYYPEGLITGYYGELTKKAVQNFQKANNLTPSGYLDNETILVLNSKIGAYFSECIGSNVTTPPSFTNITCASPYVLSNGICVLP